mmetsp:Transcript_26755/g.62774  ORF Transcript_26755/g.62774 Transcript_26755/m.62774 type:complete len:160 (-) Transcript_26755:86-565(-)
MLMLDRASCQRRPEVLGNNNNNNENTQDAIITVSEPPWGSDSHPAYLIPRGDCIVVGGTVLKGDEETAVRKEERQKLWQNAHHLGIDTGLYNHESSNDDRVQEWVGFRPLRNTVRCGFDNDNDNNQSSAARVFHSYGHGGSGWTVHVGVAKECVRQFLG